MVERGWGGVVVGDGEHVGDGSSGVFVEVDCGGESRLDSVVVLNKYQNCYRLCTCSHSEGRDLDTRGI